MACLVRFIHVANRQASSKKGHDVSALTHKRWKETHHENQAETQH
ncbi:MAG: hypothetical protein ACJA2W_001697 [Planctomycetota bacterium]|jgi:hypothetical protein